MDAGRKRAVSLTLSTIGICAGSIVLGMAIGLGAHNRDRVGATWFLILLALSAAIVGLAQQTLP